MREQHDQAREFKLREEKCPTCAAVNGGPSPHIALLQQNLAYEKDETKALREEIERLRYTSDKQTVAWKERALAAEARAVQLQKDYDDLIAVTIPADASRARTKMLNERDGRRLAEKERDEARAEAVRVTLRGLPDAYRAGWEAAREKAATFAEDAYRLGGAAGAVEKNIGPGIRAMEPEEGK